MCLITAILIILGFFGGIFGIATVDQSGGAVVPEAVQVPSNVRTVVGSGNYELLTIPDNDGNTYFVPRQSIQTEAMDALLIGTFTEQNGCLLVDGLLVVWAPGYDLLFDSDGVALTDQSGTPLARIGDNVTLSGGEVPAQAFEAENAIFPLENCAGLTTEYYWLMGNEFRLTE